MKTPTPTPTPWLPFQRDPEPATETLTACGGLPLVAQTVRSRGLPQRVARPLRLTPRRRGVEEATLVERVVLLHAAGGDGLEDVRRLAEEPGVPTWLGHARPWPDTARTCLYAFHQDEALATATAQRPAGQPAFIPEETEPWQGVAPGNVDLGRAGAARGPAHRIATSEQEATIHERHPRAARPHDEGGRGSQPMTAVWAEWKLVVADQCREGTVPAGGAPVPVAQAACAARPATGQAYDDRGDAACHASDRLTWRRNPARPHGPGGRMGCARSARMRPAVAAARQALPETAWPPDAAPGEAPDARRDWADGPFVPSEARAQRETAPGRSVATRVRPRHGARFADGTAVTPGAVRSNPWDGAGARRLPWHRETAGSSEPVHEVVTHERAGGVRPCGRVGANAAWRRLAWPAHHSLDRAQTARVAAGPADGAAHTVAVPGGHGAGSAHHPCATAPAPVGDDAGPAGTVDRGPPARAGPDLTRARVVLPARRSRLPTREVCPARPRSRACGPSTVRPDCLGGARGLPGDAFLHRVVVIWGRLSRLRNPSTSLRPD